MIKKLTIKNFRNIKHLHINPITQINLLIGKNDVGKTSILNFINMKNNNSCFRNNMLYKKPLPINPCMEKAIILIDEIENGVHHNYHEHGWELINGQATKLNQQFFITTHSYESLQAFSEVFNNKKTSAQVIRIEWRNDNHKCVIFNKKRLAFFMEKYWEIR